MRYIAQDTDFLSPVTRAYLTYEPAIRRCIARLTGGLYTHDIAQEAFLRVYSMELRRPIEQPKSYLFRAAKHEALRWRERHRRLVYDEPPDQPGHGPEDEAIGQETWRTHLDAVASLSPVVRQVFWLKVHRQLSHPEIAAILGITVSTVEKHSIRAARCRPVDM
jgi:RNA polymerase sigma-70 factor (ECF subfamily)